MSQGLSGIATRMMLVLMVALAITACGRRGNLEAPQTSTVISVDENGNEVETSGPPAAEDKPFVLDPLL